MWKSLNRLVRSNWPKIVLLWDVVFFITLGWAIYWWTTIALDISISLEDKRPLLVGFGGFTLSVLALYITTFRPFLRKPRLKLIEDKQWSESPTPNDTSSWFYRLRIENYGLTVAENCVGRLIGVWIAKDKPIKKFDPLSLYWARQNKITEDDREIITFEPIDIQGYGDFYFLDLAQVKGEEPIWLRVVIPLGMTLTKEPENSPSPGSDPILKVPGTYYVRVGIYAKDAYIKPTYLKICCPAEKITQPLSSTNSPCEICEVKKLPGRKWVSWLGAWLCFDFV